MFFVAVCMTEGWLFLSYVKSKKSKAIPVTGRGGL
jgi:hypothetical protein